MAAHSGSVNFAGAGGMFRGYDAAAPPAMTAISVLFRTLSFLMMLRPLSHRNDLTQLFRMEPELGCLILSNNPRRRTPVCNKALAA